jgi:hypothetical protein
MIFGELANQAISNQVCSGISGMGQECGTASDKRGHQRRGHTLLARSLGFIEDSAGCPLAHLIEDLQDGIPGRPLRVFCVGLYDLGELFSGIGEGLDGQSTGDLARCASSYTICDDKEAKFRLRKEGILVVFTSKPWVGLGAKADHR